MTGTITNDSSVNICPFTIKHPEMLIGIPENALPDVSTDSKQSEYSANTESWD